MPLPAALQLIRLEGQRIGVAELSAAAESDLEPIYQVVGGNAMALKLVVGQLRFHSLDRVLSRFRHKQQGSSGSDLFTYIYQEIWDNLPEESQTTLLALAQAGEDGFTFDHLAEVAQLNEEIVERHLEQLILLSLVDTTGTLFSKRYRLHRLTDAFIRQLMEG